VSFALLVPANVVMVWLIDLAASASWSSTSSQNHVRTDEEAEALIAALGYVHPTCGGMHLESCIRLGRYMLAIPMPPEHATVSPFMMCVSMLGFVGLN